MLLLPLAAAAALAAAPTPIAGRWITEDGAGVVEIGRCGGSVCGRLVRILKAPADAPTTDRNNADPAARDRPLVGLPILTGFAPDGAAWRGEIYDPRSGRTYRSVVARQGDGTLKVRGCIAFLCRTQRWRPVA